MKESEWIDQFVYDVIEHYEAEVLVAGLIYLELSMEGHGVLVIEEKIKHKRMAVSYFLYDGQGHPVVEPQLLFYLDDSSHWFPYEIHRHTGGHQVFAVVADEHGAYVATDPEGQEALAAFADQWAELLRSQGWIGGAEKAITQPQQWPTEEEAPYMPPSVDELWALMDEQGTSIATDGCSCPVDGTCEHGHRSWLVEWGLI